MAAAYASELELARLQCRELHDRLAATAALPRGPAHRSLLRLVDAELRFLTSQPAASSSRLSSNLPHLAALHLLLTHPSVLAPSRLSPLPGVDFACAFRSRPAWALLSARNPSRLPWAPRVAGERGLRDRVGAVLAAARAATPAARPEALLLVFSRGVGADVARALVGEFGAVEVDLIVDSIEESDGEEGWVHVRFHPREKMRSFRAFEIAVMEVGSEVLPQPTVMQEAVAVELRGEVADLGMEGGFGSFVRKMRADSRELVNLDTTALVAIVSAISNGGVGKLMDTPEVETRARFKGNFKFIMEQALSELQSPILVELEKAVDGRKCIVCETVNSEFQEIISMCGGPDERNRASQLLKQLTIVPDSPSARAMDLPTTRKLAMKNKIIFGTGDHWRAPTLTANMGFVRAVSQAGMPLLTVEHRPLALIGL